MDGPVLAFPSVDLITTVGWARPIALEGRTVYVWGFSLDGETSTVEQCRAWLSEDERARAARFIRDSDQRRYILAHGGLRAVLARYLAVSPGALTFRAAPTGKPALLNGDRPHDACRFNLSHSHGRMLMAVTNGYEVGADLEQIRGNVEAVKLAERFYTPSERDRVAGATGSEQAQRFYRYWVAKEAVLKGQGVGLLSLQHCEILSPDTPIAEVRLLDGAAMQPGWAVHWLECGDGWAGAVSVHGRDWAVCSMTGA